MTDRFAPPTDEELMSDCGDYSDYNNDFRDSCLYDDEDDYGNPLDGNSKPYCSFPDCGCDGARCCEAEGGFGSNPFGRS